MMVKMEGRTTKVASVAAKRPPMTARPSGAVCSPPSPRPRARGNIGFGAFQPAAFGKGDKQNRIGDGNADSHDCAHERLNVNGGSCQPKSDNNAGDDGGS